MAKILLPELRLAPRPERALEPASNCPSDAAFGQGQATKEAEQQQGLRFPSEYPDTVGGLKTVPLR